LYYKSCNFSKPSLGIYFYLSRVLLFSRHRFVSGFNFCCYIFLFFWTSFHSHLGSYAESKGNDHEWNFLTLKIKRIQMLSLHFWTGTLLLFVDLILFFLSYTFLQPLDHRSLTLYPPLRRE